MKFWMTRADADKQNDSKKVETSFRLDSRINW